MTKRLPVKRQTALFAAALLLLIGVFATASFAGSTTYRVAYLATGQKGFDLYMMDSDGTDKIKVDESVVTFSWAPDGQRLVYNKGVGDSLELFTADLSGTPERLFDFCASTGSGLYCYHPIWSPDSSQIAFDAVGNLSGGQDIYIVDADGTNVRKVTRSGQTQLSYELSDWSVAGQLAFKGCSGKCRAGVINEDGSGHKLLSPKKYGSNGGVFNNDGTRLAYVAGNTGYDIYTIGVNGKGRKRLTDTKPGESRVAYRPDGKLSFLMQGPNYTYKLWRINANGRDKTKLQGGDNGRPDWRSDDGSALYVKVIKGDAWLVIGNADAKNVEKIYEPPKYLIEPAWGGVVTE